MGVRKIEERIEKVGFFFLCVGSLDLGFVTDLKLYRKPSDFIESETL